MSICECKSYCAAAMSINGRTCRQCLCGNDTPWPLKDVLAKLVEAADHLLGSHNCDVHGWEEYQIAASRGKEILSSLEKRG